MNAAFAKTAGAKANEVGYSATSMDARIQSVPNAPPHYLYWSANCFTVPCARVLVDRRRGMSGIRKIASIIQNYEADSFEPGEESRGGKI